MHFESRKHYRQIAVHIFPLIIVCAIHGLAQTVVRVSDYGAIPNDGKADETQIQNAISACKSLAQSKLVFDPGTYDLVQLNQYNQYLSIWNISNLTIEGNGAVLLAHEWGNTLVSGNNKNMTIHNIVFDVKKLPFCGGIVRAQGTQYFDLEPVAPHTALAGVRAEGVLAYDRANERVGNGVDIYQYEDKEKRTTEILGNGRMRVFTIEPLPAVGKAVIVRFQIYGRNAITMQSGENITFRNVAIYAAAGMGIWGSNIKDILVDSLTVDVPDKSGRWMSTNADATHFNCCRGKVQITNSIFRKMGDDATNIHQVFLRITSVSADGFVAEGARGWNKNFAPHAGDTLEIGGGANPLVPFTTVVVESATIDETAKVFSIILTAPRPSSIQPGHYIGNRGFCPSALIKNCTVENNRARGLLIKTRNVIVENNVIRYSSLPAVYFECDVKYWMEGVGTRDVTVRNNTFTGCNFWKHSYGAMIDAFGEVGNKLASSGVHRRLTIAGNTFAGLNGPAVRLVSTTDAKISCNTVKSPPVAPFFIQNSDSIDIVCNTITGYAGTEIQKGSSVTAVRFEEPGSAYCLKEENSCDTGTTHVTGQSGLLPEREGQYRDMVIIKNGMSDARFCNLIRRRYGHIGTKTVHIYTMSGACVQRLGLPGQVEAFRPYFRSLPTGAYVIHIGELKHDK